MWIWMSRVMGSLVRRWLAVLVFVVSLPTPGLAEVPGLDGPFVGWQSPFVAAGSSGASAISFVPGVWAQTVWDRGDGPALYAAGNFVTIHDVYSPGIARWDGSAWETVALFDQPDNAPGFAVLAMLPYQGELIIAGSFFDIEGQPARNIIRYDGSQWQPLAGSSGVGTNGMVQSLAVYQGELIVGGEFAQAGGLAVNGIARWDGSDWHTLANPFQSSARFYALENYAGELVAGGNLTASSPAVSQVARWNGSQWQPLAGPSGQGVAQDPGFGVQVNALTAAPDGLVVGGRFASAGGIAARNLARWDGSQWSAYGTGLGNVTHQVHALAIVDQRLYAAGSFPGADALASPNIIAWHDGQWQALAGPDGVGAGPDVVLSLINFADQLYLAGMFSQAGGLLSPGIARWDGNSFDTVVNRPVTGLLGGSPEAAMLHDGRLVVGGSFQQAGSVKSARIAAWNGTDWEAMAGGLFPGQVNAMVEYQGDLVVGGSFTFAPDPDGDGSTGQTVNRIARWDGTAWQPMANGFGGTVEALHIHGGQLYAAGGFAAAGGFGGAPLARIARWNGSAWEAVDGGLGGLVFTLGSHDGELLAGGSFTTLGNGDEALRMARWNAQDGWRSLGDNLTTGTVRSLAVFQGQLYAGGSFGAPPSGTSPRHLARWDGEQWQPVDHNGAELSWHVDELLASATELYVGGRFEQIGDLALHCVARYSPTQGWRDMSGPSGTGLSQHCGGISHFLLTDQVLVAVGRFIVAGGRVGHQIAFWSLFEDGLFRDRFQVP